MNKIIFATIGYFLTLQTAYSQPTDIPYQDPGFACITSAEAEKYIQDFSIDVSSFGGKELCNSQVDTKKLFNDIQIIENGTFSSTGQNNLIRGFVDSNKYYSWMTEQTRGVQRGNDVPWATAYNSGGYFTMQDGWAKSSTLGRVGTFIHEARHTEGYMHIPCNHGPYQGVSLNACDSTYSYGGSHAVEMEYYARVSVQGTNFHPVYKKMARLMAIARSNFVFNKIVMQPREAVLALNQDRSQAHLFDQGTWTKREVPGLVGQLKRTSFGAVIFSGLKAMSIELYKNSGFPDMVEDAYSYYKLLAETSNVKEYEEFESGPKRFVVKVSQDDKISAWDFPNGAWGREQSLPFKVSKTSTSIPGLTKPGFFLISADNQVYNYVPESQRLVKQNANWDSGNKDVVVFKGQNLILRNDGKIYSQMGGTLQPWAESTDLYSALVTVPMYDAFEVVKD